MERRCKFLDNFPGYNYNIGYGEYKVNKHGQKRLTNTRCLGSTLMNTMLKEVGEFCDPTLKDNWSQKPHQQVNDYMVGLLGAVLLDSLIYDHICYNPACHRNVQVVQYVYVFEIPCW